MTYSLSDFSGVTGLALASLLLVGCGSDSDDTPTSQVDCAAANNCAVIANNDTAFQSGVIDIINSAAPFSGAMGLNGSGGDIVVNTIGSRYFVIGRFQTDTVTAYDFAAPSTAIFQASTNDPSEPDVSSNPQTMIFLNEEKAYVLRYGSSKVWIVNPSATDAANFKVGEIDLAVYDSVGPPEMVTGAIVDGKLFVVMQRLGGDSGFTPVQNGFISVIDTATDTEIDTGSSSELLGIELPGFNPTDMSVDPLTDDLFVAAVGQFAGFDGSPPVNPVYSGGLFRVDSSDFSVTSLIDDTATTGQFSQVEVVDASAAYYVSVAVFGDHTLVKFDPSTGTELVRAAAGIANVDIRDLARSNDGQLWVGVGDLSTPHILVVEPAVDDVPAAQINTSLNPASIAFQTPAVP